jgi:hypothetical protein
MTFSNQKEETLNLELTSYGKYLLSLGKLKPHQYAFFDEDIIYDRQFLSGTAGEENKETQNSIEGRIQEETPRLRPQSLYRPAQIGVFSENASHVNNLMPGVVSAADKKAADFLLEHPESSYIFSDPIGNSAYNSKNIAAWDVGFYKSKLYSVDYAWTGSSDATITGSTSIPTTFIPQLNCKIQYEAHFFANDPDSGPDEVPKKVMNAIESFDNTSQIDHGFDGTSVPYILEDKSYLAFFSDFTFLKIEEANTEFMKENFDLEVYMVSDEANNDSPEQLERLFFANGETTDTKHVEYYFDLDFDFDIDKEEFCSLSKEKQKIKNIYSDKIFDCDNKEKDDLTSMNIYGTAENQDIKDVCD